MMSSGVNDVVSSGNDVLRSISPGEARKFDELCTGLFNCIKHIFPVADNLPQFVAKRAELLASAGNNAGDFSKMDNEKRRNELSVLEDPLQGTVSGRRAMDAVYAICNIDVEDYCDDVLDTYVIEPNSAYPSEVNRPQNAIYARLCEFLEERAAECLHSIMQATANFESQYGPSLFICLYSALWTKYCDAVTVLNVVFGYLNTAITNPFPSFNTTEAQRAAIRNSAIPGCNYPCLEVGHLSQIVWSRMVLQKIVPQISSSYFHLLNSIRSRCSRFPNAHPTPPEVIISLPSDSQDLIASINLITMIMTLEEQKQLSRVSILEIIENSCLSATKEFFQRDAEFAKRSCDLNTTVEITRSWVTTDSSLLSAYFQSLIIERFSLICLEEFYEKYKEDIKNEITTLNKNNKNLCKSVWDSFKNVANCKTSMVSTYPGRINTWCRNMLVTSSPLFVEKFIELLNIRNDMEQVVFSDDKSIVDTANLVLQQFVSQCTTFASYSLALFIHFELLGISKPSRTMPQNNSPLEMTQKVLSFIHDIDEFVRFYVQLLSSRLAKGNLCDIDKESKFIAALSSNCGAMFSYTANRMINEYNESLKSSTFFNEAYPTSTNMSALVFCKFSWNNYISGPVFESEILPKQLIAQASDFTSFFNLSNSNKILSIHWSRSSVELQLNGYDKAYTVTMPMGHAVVLDMFNEEVNMGISKQLSCVEIAKMIPGFIMQDVLLTVMSLGRVGLLRKSNKKNDWRYLQVDENVEINLGFTHWRPNIAILCDFSTFDSVAHYRPVETNDESQTVWAFEYYCTIVKYATNTLDNGLSQTICETGIFTTEYDESEIDRNHSARLLKNKMFGLAEFMQACIVRFLKPNGTCTLQEITDHVISVCNGRFHGVNPDSVLECIDYLLDKSFISCVESMDNELLLYKYLPYLAE